MRIPDVSGQRDKEIAAIMAITPKKFLDGPSVSSPRA
jgi:hypothetical protein